MLDVLMLGSWTAKHSEVKLTVILEVFCTNPHLERLFLTTAGKVSSPDGAWVLNPTAWQQAPSPTPHVSCICSYRFLNTHRFKVTQQLNIKCPEALVTSPPQNKTRRYAYFPWMSTPVSLSFHLHLEDNNWSYYTNTQKILTISKLT